MKFVLNLNLTQIKPSSADPLLGRDEDFLAPAAFGAVPKQAAASRAQLLPRAESPTCTKGGTSASVGRRGHFGGGRLTAPVLPPGGREEAFRRQDESLGSSVGLTVGHAGVIAGPPRASRNKQCVTPTVPAQRAHGAPVLGQARGQAGEGSCGWHPNAPDMRCLLLVRFWLLRGKIK